MNADGEASARLAAMLDDPEWERDWDHEFAQWLSGLSGVTATFAGNTVPTRGYAPTESDGVPGVARDRPMLEPATPADLLAHCPCCAGTAPASLTAPDLDLAAAAVDAAAVDAQAARVIAGIAAARQGEAQAVWQQVGGLSRLFERWRGQGGPDDLVPASVVTEVALACSMSEYAVGRRLDAAWALINDTRLPRLAALMEDGRADWAKVSMLVRETSALTPEAAGAVDALVVDLVPELNVPRLTAAVRAAIAAVDPEGQARRSEQEHRRRGVTFRPAEDGMGEIGVWAPLEAVTAVRVQLDAAVARARAAGDRRGPGEIRCDELIGRVTGATWSTAGEAEDDGPQDVGAPRFRASRSHPSEQPVPEQPVPEQHVPEQPEPLRQVPSSHLAVTLTMTLSTWLGMRDDPAVLDGGHTVAGRPARDLAVRMARDATWRCAVVDDEHGTLLGLGRPIRTPGYVPGRRLAAFVRAAEPLCCVPGCGARAHRCDLDHRIPYPAGATCSCNLQPTCRRHHRLKSAGHLSSRAVDDPRGPAGAVEWTTRSGRTHLRRPAAVTPFAGPGVSGDRVDRRGDGGAGRRRDTGGGDVDALVCFGTWSADPDPPPF